MSPAPTSFREALKPLWQRTGQLLWLLNHWNDVEADALVFYRIDDVANYPDAAKFFRLASRLPAYRGVMRERLMAEQAEREQVGTPTSTPSAPKSKIKSSAHRKGYRQVNNPAEQSALLHSVAEAKSVEVANSRSYLEERLKNTH